MKARIALAALMIAAPAGMASAQGPVQGRVAVDGTVAGRCVLGPPSLAAVPLGTLIDTTGPRAGRLRAIAAQTINFPGSWCNFANTRISVSANAILAADPTAPAAGFARAVNFTSTVTNWAAANAAVTTAASAGGGTPAANGSGGTHPAPKLADLTMTLNNFAVPSDLLLVTGNYAGAVTITLGPAS
jgi:hypothetical protein